MMVKYAEKKEKRGREEEKGIKQEDRDGVGREEGKKEGRKEGRREREKAFPLELSKKCSDNKIQ